MLTTPLLDAPPLWLGLPMAVRFVAAPGAHDNESGGRIFLLVSRPARGSHDPSLGLSPRQRAAGVFQWRNDR